MVASHADVKLPGSCSVSETPECLKTKVDTNFLLIDNTFDEQILPPVVDGARIENVGPVSLEAIDDFIIATFRIWGITGPVRQKRNS